MGKIVLNILLSWFLWFFFDICSNNSNKFYGSYTDIMNMG